MKMTRNAVKRGVSSKFYFILFYFEFSFLLEDSRLDLHSTCHCFSGASSPY